MEPPSNPLLGYILAHPWKGPFRSHAVYFEVGDFITCYFENVPCIAEDDTSENVCVYRAMDDNRIVGFKVYGASRLVCPPSTSSATVARSPK